MTYRHAAALFPRALSKVAAATYAPDYQVAQRQPSPDYVQAMRDRDARAFWASAARPSVWDARPEGAAAYSGPVHVAPMRSR